MLNQTSQKTIFDAASTGDLPRLQWLIANGATLAEKDNYNNTALLWAAINGHLETVKWLLQNGAMLIERNNYGRTALLLAALNGQLETVKWLLQNGATLAEKDGNGNTALLLAASRGHLETVKWLLQNGATLAEKDNDGNTALLLAAFNDKLQVVQWLLQNGATLAEKNNDGSTTLDMARELNQTPLSLWLALFEKTTFPNKKAVPSAELDALLAYKDNDAIELQNAALEILFQQHQLDIFIATYTRWLPKVVLGLSLKEKCQVIQSVCKQHQWEHIAPLMKQLQLTYENLFEFGDVDEPLPRVELNIILGELRGLKNLLQQGHLLISDEKAITAAINLAQQVAQVPIADYLANKQRQYKREQVFQALLFQQQRITNQQFGHDVLTDQLKTAITDNVQELPILKHQQALFAYLSTLAETIKTTQIKPYDEFIQLIDNCKIPYDLLIFPIDYPPALRSFWYEIPPYARNHPCFTQLNHIIEKLNQWMRELQTTSLSSIINSHLIAIKNAYEEFIKQTIAAAKIIEPHMIFIQTTCSTLPFEVQTKLNLLIKDCLEPACLIKPEAEFGFFQSSWKGYPPNIAKHPCFATLQSRIEIIEEYLKELTLPGKLKLALVLIQKTYEEYIQEVIANTAVTQFNEAASRGYFSKSSRIIGKHFPHHTLIAGAERKFLSNERSNETGQHTVVALNGVHYKYCPYAPGIEFTVGSLNAHLLGQGSPPTELLKIIDTKGKHHVFLASKSVQGTDLQYIIEQKPDWFKKINLFNFSAMVISGLLVNHQDGKPDNFMVSYTLDGSGEVDSLDIIGIDNDIAFAHPFIRSDNGKYYVDVRNVLYFFPQMQQPLDKVFREKLMLLNPEQVMIEWLRSVYHQNQHTFQALLTQGVFHETEFKGNPEIYGQMSMGEGKENTAYSACPYEAVKKNKLGLQLPIKLVAGTAAKIYITLKQIQSILLENENLTHDQLFALVQPYLHYYYQGVRIKFQNKIMRCINYLYDSTNHALQSVMRSVQPEQLRRNLKRGELNLCTSVAIEAASQQRSFESNRTQSIEAEIETFIATINFSEMDERIEKLILKELRSLNFMQHLVLWGIRITGVEFVRYFLNQDTQTQAFPQLKTLTLKSCKGITLQTLNDFMTHSQLKSIELTLDDHCQPLKIQDWLVLSAKEQCPKLMVYNHVRKPFDFDLYRYHNRPERYLFQMLEQGIYSEIALGWLAEQFKKNGKSINFPCDKEINCLHALALQVHPHLAKLAEFLLEQGIDKAAVDKNGATVLDKLVKRIQQLEAEENALSMQLPYLYPLLCCFIQHKISSKIPLGEIQCLIEKLERKLAPAPWIQFKFFEVNEKKKKEIPPNPYLKLGQNIFSFFNFRDQQAWSCVSKEQQQFVKHYY